MNECGAKWMECVWSAGLRTTIARKTGITLYIILRYVLPRPQRHASSEWWLICARLTRIVLDLSRGEERWTWTDFFAMYHSNKSAASRAKDTLPYHPAGYRFPISALPVITPICIIFLKLDHRSAQGLIDWSFGLFTRFSIPKSRDNWVMIS